MPEKKEGTEVVFLGKTMVFGVKSLNIVVNITQNLLFQSIKLLKKHPVQNRGSHCKDQLRNKEHAIIAVHHKRLLSRYSDTKGKRHYHPQHTHIVAHYKIHHTKLNNKILQIY